MNLLPYLHIIQIIISGGLIAIIMAQSNASGVGSVFGGDSSFHRTRRGVEKTMHQATVGMALAFFLISILSVVVAA
jgi:preprotein translocase subunit SecG